MFIPSKARLETASRALLPAGTCCVALLATWVIVLTGCVGPRPAAAAPAPAPAPAQTAKAAFAEQAVQLPTDDLALSGVLFVPAVTPKPGERRPAIVLMHGCAGMNDSRGNLAARHRDWAERFARWGFVALTVDSFGPRGITALCELKDRPIQPWKERTADAHAALRWLAARADVDPTRVFLLGWSHGGSTVMGVARPHAPGSDAAGPHFRAAVAFYPGCMQPLRHKPYRTTMPLLILHGEADDWTPAAPCVELAHRLQADKLPVRTVTYPGAHHGFDQPMPGVRLLPNVYNPSAVGERGAHVGQHPQARRAAIDEVKAFVEQQLRG